jgi:uncharacterized protein YpmB
MKKERKKINYWILSTLILLIALSTMIFFKVRSSEQVYDINGFKIPISSFNSLTEVNTEDKFDICSIDQDKCITLHKTYQPTRSADK